MTDHFERAVNATDEARYVKWDATGDIVAVWHGGPTVNVYWIYDSDAKPIDTFTIGDESTTDIPLEEAKESMIEYLKEDTTHGPR